MVSDGGDDPERHALLALAAMAHADAKAGRVKSLAKAVAALSARPLGRTSDRVEVSLAAWQDIVAIHRRLAAEAGRGHAEAFAARLAERACALSDAPDRGRAVGLPVGDVQLRSVLLAPYRIFYAVVADTVVIFAVLEPHRDLATLLEKRRCESDPA